MTELADTHKADGSTPRVFQAWWPLALSWLMMGIEMPLITAVLGRLPESEVMLAAFGGVVFPLGLLIESPIIMMLAASTALADDAVAWHKLNRIMHLASAVLTALFAAMALVPALFDVIVMDLLDVPAVVQPHVRAGMLWLLPWTWAIADRRTRQGLLIRHGRKIAVAQGTGLRLFATVAAVLGFAAAEAPGVTVACAGLSIGVLTEAAWARWAARDIVRDVLPNATVSKPQRATGPLLRFYLPLALTPMLVLLAQPLGTAGMSRMADPVASMAVWAPLNGLLFMLRSTGMAYNEVVIAHVGAPGWLDALQRFGHRMGLCCSGVVAILCVPMAGAVWFGGVVGLDTALVQLGLTALWLGIPIPWLTFVQSLYQGRLVEAHRTAAVTWSVAMYLAITALALVLGVAWFTGAGLLVAVAATTAGNAGQAVWLWAAARKLPVLPPQEAPETIPAN